jgi:ribosomal protein S18 acetylase RimI-like enzyme
MRHPTACTWCSIGATCLAGLEKKPRAARVRLGHNLAMRVRHAEVGDADRIAEIHIASWRAAYRGKLDEAYLAALDVAPREVGWRQTLLGSGESETVVADLDSVVVGFAHFGPARDLVPTVGEVYAMYLAPDAWGRGIGRSLLLAVERRLRRRGFEHAMLYVLESNDRAIRFYEASGWERDGGEKRDQLGGRLVTELRYAKQL